MQKFKKKFLINIGITLGIVLAMVLFLFLFRSLLRKSSEKVRASKIEINNRSNAIQRLAFLKGQFSKTASPYLNVLYSVIPPKDELINFSKELQVIAASENLTFSFSFLGENASTGEDLGSVSFSVNVTGQSIDEIFDFIEKLERFRFLIKLENFSINSDSGFRATIGGRVFFR